MDNINTVQTTGAPLFDVVENDARIAREAIAEGDHDRAFAAAHDAAHMSRLFALDAQYVATHGSPGSWDEAADVIRVVGR